MTTPHNKILSHVLKTVQETKVPIKALNEMLDELVYCKRTAEEQNHWLMRSGPLKKVCDEVFPVARLFKHLQTEDGAVTFPLDSKVPDCWWFREGKAATGIEVTVSQGRARHILARELAEEGIGRGYLPLQDGATKDEATAARENTRVMYTSAGALATMSAALTRCLRQKNDPKYDGMILIIETDMTPLRPVAYQKLVPELAEAAATMPFSEIYAIGKGEKLIGLKLK